MATNEVISVAMAPPGSEFTLRTSIYPAIEPSQFKEYFTGKAVLVTGSGRGIGREIALDFAKCGAAVAITGRTSDEVEQTRKDAESLGAKTIGIVADASKSGDLKRLVNQVWRLCFLLDVLN